MPLGDYLAGLFFLALTAGPAVAAAILLTRRRLSHLDGVAGPLAMAILATTGLLLAHLLPGLAGVLSRGAAATVALLLLAATLLACRGRPGRPWLLPRIPAPPESAVGRMSLAAAGLGALVVVCWSVAVGWISTVTPSTDVDTLTFHVPNVLKWIQTGSVWRTDQFIPLLANGNYPQNGDVVMLTALLPWNSDAFLRLAGLPFAAVAGLSVYALARECGARASASMLMGSAFAAVPVFVLAAYEGAKTDSIMLAMLGAGTYFLLRSLRDGHRSSLVLGALGLGIAFGTKWYGLWSVAVVVLVWAVAWLYLGRPRRELATAGAWVLGIVALAGGVWMLRNAIESGSPVYPSAVKVFSLTLFDTPRDIPRECGGFTILDYLGDSGVWRDLILPAYRAGYGGPGLVLACGWLLAGATLVARIAKGNDRAPLAAPMAVTAMVPLLVLAYSLTPYSAIGPEGEPFVQANLRWLLPALLMAGAAGAWAVSELPPRVRALAEVAVVAAIVVSIRRGIDVPLEKVALVTAGLAAVAAVLGLAAAGWRRGGAARMAAVAAVVGVVVAFVAAGDRRQDTFAKVRYVEDPVTARLVSAASEADRVGLAGVWSGDGLSPVLPAFGAQLDADVSFVGSMVDGQLREYETRGAFLRAVRRGGYDVLVVGRGTAGYGPCDLPGKDTDEDRWSREAGFRLVAQTPRLSLYRPRG